MLSPKGSGKAITFASFRQQVFTRADIEAYNFEQNTLYTLLAVKSADTESAYAWNNGKGFSDQPEQGKEGDDGKIEYSPLSTYPEDSSLDFFGLTYSSETQAPALDAAVSDGVTPTITIAEASGTLPDLMHCNDAKRKTATDGTVILPFQHALAALNLMISREDISETSNVNLDDVVVTGIQLDNVAKRATLNVVTGQWTWSADDVGSRVIFSGSKPVDKDLNGDLRVGPEDFLVFPNGIGETDILPTTITISLSGIKDNHGSYLNATLENGVTVSGGKCTVSVPIRKIGSDGNDGGPLKMERNHKYTLSISVMRSNVRIITVSPQVFDWETVTLEKGDGHRGTLGQPVTFGGVVWMDRNLGASTADCQNDWWNSLGYYYEYARNIPFMLNVPVITSMGYCIPDKYVTNLETGAESTNTTKYLCDNNRQIVYGYVDQDPAFKDYVVYTWDNNGNKVSLVSNTTLAEMRELPENAGKSDSEILAINPGDTGSYTYVYAFRNIEGVGGEFEGSTTGVWYDKKPTDFIQNYWYSVRNQPVPKGWRLPTGKDAYSILPDEDFYWVNPDYNAETAPHRFQQVGIASDATLESHYPKHTFGPALEFNGDYVYQFFFGDFEVDESADKNAEWSSPVYNDINRTRLYGIKYQGTSRAYRYMITIHDSNIHNGAFVRFSLFPASPNDRLISNVNDVDGAARDAALNLVDRNPKWNLHKFDWDNPSSYMDFPMSGHIADQKAYVNLLGRDLKLRLQDFNLPRLANYCFKLSNDGVGVAMTYDPTTCPIRLVRDL